MSRPASFDALLDRAAATRRRAAFAVEATRGAAALVTAWVLALLLDVAFDLHAALRLALLVLLGPAAVLALAWRLSVAARVRPSRAEAARLLETRCALPGNPLIDAVLLDADAREGRAGVAPSLAERVVAEAGHVAVRVDARSAGEGPRVARAATVLAAAGAVAALGALLWPGASGAAVVRFLRPFEAAPAPGGLVVEVSPGATRVPTGSSVDVRARVRAELAARLPSDADVEVEVDGRTAQRTPMSARGTLSTERRFEARVDVEAVALRYRVLAGAAASPWYRIEVMHRPAIAAVAVRLVPPAYTGRAPEELPVGPAGVAALVGTEATLVLSTTRPCREGKVTFPGASPQAAERLADGRFATSVRVERGGPVTARLLGEDGVEAADVPVTTWAAVEDALPAVRLEASAQSLVVDPGERVDFAVRAEDDVGLAALRLVGSVEGEAKEVTLWQVPFPAPGPAAARERPSVVLDPGGFEPGRTYRFVAEADDRAPARTSRARSAPVLVRVRGLEDLRAPEGSPLARAFERLRALVEAVRAERARVGTLLDLYAEHEREGRLARRAEEARAGHEALPARFAEVEALFRAEPTGAKAAAALAAAREEELASARAAMAETKRPGDARGALARARDADDRLVARLLALLGELAAKAPPEGAPKPVAEAPRSPADRLSQLAQDLARFVSEQRKVLDATKDVEKRASEDLTQGDEALLGSLAAQEAAWAKLFEEAFTDLSKVPSQDFADGSLLKELNQVYMEVQRAAEALSDRKVELAVPAEQSGLELAERLETNLERWIPDTPDREKWVMEEPPQEYDVPLADLPDELEDIVGDLLDDEAQMDEDVEDVSSSWMDSLDKGAGWDATDGPISNMSARGITGNRLPNQNEIGGRSGEGRSGKSHGQMVEETAEGKGGRETPTRKTESPFEAGSVKDSSKDPRGGATGGGKVAGQGDSGLRGTPPPPVQAKLERLRGNQGELRQQAERLQRWLRALHLPAGDVDDAIARMKRIEENIAAGRGFDLRQAHADVKSALELARRALVAEADTLRAQGAALSPEVRRELFSGLREPVPPGLEAVVKAFYEALSRGAGPAPGK